jgi:radical SAM superfamily enzyme YgiQ (UPF0313 family)
MNILLLYPEFPDTFWSFKHALKFIRKNASFPPLGLLTVASMLPDDWNVRLVDLNVEELKLKQIAWADCAFISAMIVQRDSTRKLIASCREAGLRVVAGGPLFTNEPEQFADVDHLVLNEAEVTLPGFLEDLKNGCAKRVYESAEHPDVEDTPIPAWHLLKLGKYASMSIQYSRGCPFSCDFCNVTAMFGHKPRVKSSSQVIAELDALLEAGWNRQVFFVDDNFIGNKRHLKKELLPDLIEWQSRQRRNPRFHTEASINLADDDELMHMMVEAGFHEVFIGIETPNDDSLVECKKMQNANRDMLSDVKHIQRAGLQVQGGFIVGFDSDTESVFQKQIDFIQNSGIVTAMVGLLQAPPGTRLYERMKQQGRLLGLSSGDNVDGSTNIVPAMSLDVLKNGYRRVLENIYSPRQYYRRLKTFLRDYKAPKIRARLTREDLGAFMRSVFRLGVIGRERACYWKLLIWTAVRRPKLFHTAVTLAIYGHHFRKVCRLHVG